jgi:hypothetical protein
MTFWWLIIITAWGGHPAVDHIEFSDERSCRSAVELIEKDWQQEYVYKYCVPAGEKK